MKYCKETQVERIWHDEFDFVEWLPSLHSKRTKLSKKKILGKLSGVKNFTDIHMLLLDNLSRIFSILYYPEATELILSLEDLSSISVKVEGIFIDEFLMLCSIDYN